MDTNTERRHHEEDPNFREARQHMMAAREEMRRTVEAFLPPGVVAHKRAARREWLLAMRSMVDAAIDRMEHIDRDEPAGPANTPPAV
jgi:hypothetical protein